MVPGRIRGKAGLRSVLQGKHRFEVPVEQQLERGTAVCGVPLPVIIIRKAHGGEEQDRVRIVTAPDIAARMLPDGPPPFAGTIHAAVGAGEPPVFEEDAAWQDGWQGEQAKDR